MSEEKQHERELAAIQGSQAKDCCKQPQNLERRREREDLVINTCRVCGCRHFYAKADPISLSGAKQ